MHTLTPQSQSIAAFWPVLIFRPAEGTGGRLGLVGLLHTDVGVACPPEDGHPSQY